MRQLSYRNIDTLFVKVFKYYSWKVKSTIKSSIITGLILIQNPTHCLTLSSNNRCYSIQI